MSDEENSLLFEFLAEVNHRPDLFAKYSADELWANPHTSERMLAFHLDTTVDIASRNEAFLDRSVEWIGSRFELHRRAKVADFGCGPGLYAQRLARRGAQVTGIDFSANSLRYARNEASKEGLDIEYVEADYLDYETDRRFDLILMIMCDFCALSPAQRARLLHRFRSMLTTNGHILLDVYSPGMFEAREETTIYARDLMDGFWSPERYFGFLTTFKYTEERVLLDKYTIVDREHTRHIYNWLQCFTPAEIESEFAACGLDVAALMGDVAGRAYDPDAGEFAVLAVAAD